MPAQATHALKTGILINEFDATDQYSSAVPQYDRDMAEYNTFGDGNKTSLKGLRGAVLALEGCRKADRDSYIATLQDMLTNDNSADLLIHAPEGFAVGKAANMFKSNLNTLRQGANISQVVQISHNFLDVAGARSGRILNSHIGNETFTQPTIFSVALTDADGDRDVTFLDADGEEVGTVTIATTDDAAAVQVKVRALGAPYSTAVVTEL